MIVILDACAIIAYLRDEKGSAVVESALIYMECQVHAFNVCEVYKDCLVRGKSNLVADGLISDLTDIGMIIREDLDSVLWKQAASIKAQIK